MRTFFEIQHLIYITLSLLVFGGCSHYSVINKDAFPFETIYIDPVNNNSYAPNVQALFDTQIRQKLLESGAVRIVQNLDQADCQLFIRLENYQRSPSGRSSQDPGQITALNASLTAIVSFYDNQQGRYLIDEYALNSNEPIFFTERRSEQAPLDTKEGEYRALPKITNALAEQIAQLVLNHW